MARIHLETYGCSLNKADSAAIRALLEKAGFEFVESVDNADLIIINSCTVKTPTEHKIIKRIRELKSTEKPIVICGCLPQANPNHPGLEGVSLLGTYQREHIVEVVEEALNGNTVVLVAREEGPFKMPPLCLHNSIVSIVPIAYGCLGEPCSYCIVKSARGKLKSFPEEQILARIRESLSAGAKEIWLTAQDTAAYGQDIGTNIAKLLIGVLKIEGNFFVRLGMANPNLVKPLLPQLIETYKSPKLFKFLHLPLQSGSDCVLERMKRRYSAQEFVEIVENFRKDIPDITLATDVICGFPGETKEDFQKTLEVIRIVKPDVLNISRYWPRPGTDAAGMRGYSGNVTKARSRELKALFNQLAFKSNLKWIGWRGKALVDQPGNIPGTWQARNFAYKPIIFTSEQPELLGAMVELRVFDVSHQELRAKLA